jgi:TonB family protein
MRAAIFAIAVAVGLGAAAAGQAGQEQVFRPGEGVTPPVVERQFKPEYTAVALADRVEGVMTLECVVRADGIVGEAHVVKSLHPSLDVEALQALADWRFKPGMKDGKPVAVRVEIEMSFSLQDAEQPLRGPAVDSPEVFTEGNGVTGPTLVRDVKPQFTASAMRERAQGLVRMKCVVLPDGTVGDVKVTAHVHPDLDRSAVRAVRQWTFKPGTKDGVAVPVQIEVQMAFTLGSRK